MGKKLREIDEKIDEYLNEMDEADELEVEPKHASGEGLKDRIKKLKECKGRYDELLEEK